MRYNERSSSGAGHSGAREGSSQRGQNTRRSSSAGSRTSRSGAGRSGASGRSVSRSNYQYKGGKSSGGRRRNGRRGRGGDGFAKLAIGGVGLILAITCIVSLMKGIKKGGNAETPTELTTVAEIELKQNVRVDGIDITGMSKEEAKNAILKNYPWSMSVVWEDQSVEVPNLMEGKLDALLNEIYSGRAKEDYSLDTLGLEEAVRNAAADIAAKWDKKAKNGSVSGYDAATDKFTFSASETGIAVEQEKLASDILQALNNKQFDAQIQASVKTVEPEFSEATARERFKKLGSFTTKTTANAKRNTNVKLSAQALNGTVVKPGQEFSFNDTVGERTAAKGYQGAAAYNNGEVVEEIGGGVCQTSSTLYNAVVKSGLKTTVRRSHTYEPSYVTPGTDATVSWGGPDYKFVNNTSAGIGIRAHYADQTVTISIYGIPVLEEGETRSLKSTKIKDMDMAAPIYEEDPTLQPGTEKVKTRGSQGSRWETRLVITKNGKVVSEEVDHNVTYKGHTPVILRNSTGVVETQPGETTADASNPSQSSPAAEGAGDGLHQESSSTTHADTEKPTDAGKKPEKNETTGAPKETEKQEKPTSAAKEPTVSQAPSAVPTAPANPSGDNQNTPQSNGAAPNPSGQAPQAPDTSAPGSQAPGSSPDIPTIPPKPGA